MQVNSFEIPDVVVDSSKGDGCVLPYVSDLPDISPRGMLMKGLGFAPYVVLCHQQCIAKSVFKNQRLYSLLLVVVSRCKSQRRPCRTVNAGS
ncbi:hypothetical protein TB1_021069 [Malus domestica]